MLLAENSLNSCPDSRSQEKPPLLGSSTVFTRSYYVHMRLYFYCRCLWNMKGNTGIWRNITLDIMDMLMTECGQQLWLLKKLAAKPLHIISPCQTSVTGETIIICWPSRVSHTYYLVLESRSRLTEFRLLVGFSAMPFGNASWMLSCSRFFFISYLNFCPIFYLLIFQSEFSLRCWWTVKYHHKWPEIEKKWRALFDTITNTYITHTHRYLYSIYIPNLPTLHI